MDAINFRASILCERDAEWLKNINEINGLGSNPPSSPFRAKII
jgi:hypothetical protein